MSSKVLSKFLKSVNCYTMLYKIENFKTETRYGDLSQYLLVKFENLNPLTRHLL